MKVTVAAKQVRESACRCTMCQPSLFRRNTIVTPSSCFALAAVPQYGFDDLLLHQVSEICINQTAELLPAVNAI